MGRWFDSRRWHISSFWIFRIYPVDNSSAKTIQMKSSMTFIQSNGWTEIDLILKQILRRHIWHVSFNVSVQAPARGHHFYTAITRNRPLMSPFTTCLGYGGYIPDLTPWSERGLTLAIGFDRYRGVCFRHKVEIEIEIGYLTSHATIFQLYLWRHIDVHADLKKFDLRSGSQRHRHFVGFFSLMLRARTPLSHRMVQSWEDWQNRSVPVLDGHINGEITHYIESVPKVSHLWGKIDFL